MLPVSSRAPLNFLSRENLSGLSPAPALYKKAAPSQGAASSIITLNAPLTRPETFWLRARPRAFYSRDRDDCFMWPRPEGRCSSCSSAWARAPAVSRYSPRFRRASSRIKTVSPALARFLSVLPVTALAMNTIYLHGQDGRIMGSECCGQ